jgi:tripartite-type tricarboxylate transporter receptor subunit TctC
MQCTLKAMKILATVLALFGVASLHAAYPDRPITLVVTYPPGGTADLVGRTLAPEMAKYLGQSVVVENRGGAGGMIGGAAVAKAAPDGYTLMLDAANHGQNPALQPKMQFDTLKDFASVSLIMRVPNVLVVNPQFSVRSVPDLIKLGKQTEPGVNYATSGVGSAQHLAGELFNALTGTHLQSVHYKGGSAGILDVVSGQVPLMFSTLNLALQQSKGDRVIIVATGGESRSPNTPNIPTIAEAGVVGYSSYEWNGLFVPAGTPEPIIEKLNAAVRQALAKPEVIERLQQIGAEVIGSSPEDLEKFRRAEIAKWQRLVKDHQIKLD